MADLLEVDSSPYIVAVFSDALAAAGLTGWVVTDAIQSFPYTGQPRTIIVSQTLDRTKQTRPRMRANAPGEWNLYTAVVLIANAKTGNLASAKTDRTQIKACLMTAFNTDQGRILNGHARAVPALEWRTDPGGPWIVYTGQPWIGAFFTIHVWDDFQFIAPA